jgi:hypothetical protein
MRERIERHPNLATWLALAVGMLLVLAWSARDVALAPTQWLWLAVATVLLAGLCAWIISWEADTPDEWDDETPDEAQAEDGDRAPADGEGQAPADGEGGATADGEGQAVEGGELPARDEAPAVAAGGSGTPDEGAPEA